MGMLKEFREFAVKGNAVDMAVGIVIGGAAGRADHQDLPGVPVDDSDQGRALCSLHVARGELVSVGENP